MAPERSGQQGLIPKTEKQEVLGPLRTSSSILEDFLEIKIKEELHYQEEGCNNNNNNSLGTLVKREEDQDLTSLTWLHNNNLLKSKPLTLPEPTKKVKQEESPTSDLTEETGSDSSASHGSGRHSPVVVIDSKHLTPSVTIMEEQKTPTGCKHYTSTSKDKHVHHTVPYDPQLHVNSKPPYSFSCLIFMAIEDSHARALPVKEIYSWITDHFPYFIKAPTGWKNSVRHNLSLNKCFRKVDKAPNLGKGSLWIVDPQYRPNLLNALSKAPYHPCASLDRPAKAPILPPTTLTPQQQEFIAIRSTQSRLPNPELFPYLSKRLAASEADRLNETHESDDDSLDDVDAATAMLELKHGQNSANGYKRSDKHGRATGLVPLISTSPSEDHTYSVERTSVSYKPRHPVSPDEAYGGGSDSNDSSRPYRIVEDDEDDEDEDDEDSWSSEEQRNVASALLHLAGGSSNRKRNMDTSYDNHVVAAKRSHTHKGKKAHVPSILQRSPRKQQQGRSNNRQADDVSNNNTSRPKIDQKQYTSSLYQHQHR